MNKFLLTIIVLCIVIYSNGIQGRWVSDDITGIVQTGVPARYIDCRDVTDVTRMLCGKISYFVSGGLDYRVFHAFNISLHLINSVLVFLFLLIFFKREVSFWGALIFTAHPVHTEAVTWISGSPYLWAAMFILMTFLLYVYSGRYQSGQTGRAVDPLRKRYEGSSPSLPTIYLLSVLLYAIAMTGTAHWTLIFFPLMIVLYDFTYGNVKKNWLFWLPYLLISLGWVIIKQGSIYSRLLYLQPTSQIVAFSNPIQNFFYSLGTHFKLLVLPLNLTFYHVPVTNIKTLFLVGGITLGLILLVSPLLYKRAKPIFFALGIYVLFLAPSYSPVCISWIVAERYLYFPVVAFCICIAFILSHFKGRFKEVFVSFLIILIGFYSIRTIDRNEDWRNEIVLFVATVRSSPYSWQAHNNMGGVYLKIRDYEKALREFGLAIRLQPNAVEAHYNMALTYGILGDKNKAIECYSRVLKIKPKYKELGVKE